MKVTKPVVLSGVTISETTDWVSLSAADKAKLLPEVKSVGWKDEGRFGPVYVEFKKEIKGVFGGKDNLSINYQNSDLKHSGSEKFYANWLTMAQAAKIAKQLKTKFEQY